MTLNRKGCAEDATEIDFQRDHSFIRYAVKTAAKGEGAVIARRAHMTHGVSDKHRFDSER